MDKDFDKKEDYIRKTLTEKGYNEDKIKEYLKSKKGKFIYNKDNGYDIDLWNMDELNKAIDSFIELNKPDTKITKSKNQSSCLNNAMKKVNDEKLCIMLNTIEEIKTKKLDETEYTDMDLSIKIDWYFLLYFSENIDGSSQLPFIYRFETEPKKWNVTRSFEDIIWLYDQLQRFHPLTIVKIS